MAKKVLTQKEKRINRTITLLAWILIISGITGMVSFYLFSRKNVTTNDAQSSNILLLYPVKFQDL